MSDIEHRYQTTYKTLFLQNEDKMSGTIYIIVKTCDTTCYRFAQVETGFVITCKAKHWIMSSSA